MGNRDGNCFSSECLAISARAVEVSGARSNGPSNAKALSWHSRTEHPWRRTAPQRLSARLLSEMLNQQFRKNSDFPCGVLTGRPDDEHAARRDRIARHHLDKAAGIQIAVDEMIRKPSDAEPRYRSSG